MQLRVVDLGSISYQKALELQYRLVEQVHREEVPDTFLLLEHPPVVTLGKRGQHSDLLLSEEVLAARGVEVAWVDRGGQATYHGPGQLVGYPIVNLRHHQRKLKRFVHNLEHFIIQLLDRHYDIQAGTEEEYIGVWVENRKIAAIGISVHQAVSMHGFALNVNTDLDYFSLIVPCGIQDQSRGVTSIARETGGEVPMEQVKKQAAPLFAEIFQYQEIRQVPAAEILAPSEKRQ
ncbi:MAG TPA: lipoyl(octanoyl) transferase LipB [Sediminispirochaeta sp.]|nr:lipoyl(octanoyl) transferase LipB [Sediminispirochaeta sp.]